MNGVTNRNDTYDAWGKLLTTTGSLASTLGAYNPLRYRGYVYDRELGLYYLQSRYYDPELCRFLNADAYVSTGQGELGNNMFVYCLNNPVCFSDPTGALTDGQIHDAVLATIIYTYMSTGYYTLSMQGTLIYYNGRNWLSGWGFCDLYDSATGEIWELKKSSAAYSCTTKYAKRQLGKYINGCLAKYPDLLLSRGGDLIYGKQKFTITTEDGIYTVTYWQECQGILRYSYTFQKRNNQQSVQNIRAALILGGGAMLVAGFCMTGSTGADATPLVLPQIRSRIDQTHIAA